MRIVFVALLLAAAAVASLPLGWERLSHGERASLAQGMLQDPEFVEQINVFQDLFVKSQNFRRASDLPNGALDMKCGVCGVVVNELEGLLAENLTIDFIQAKLDADVCSHLSGDLGAACSLLVSQLPTLVTFVDNRWDVSVACIELGFCTNDFPNRPLTMGMPTYTINLDLAPAQRWTEICSNASYVSLWNEAVAYVVEATPDHGAKLEDFGQLINSLIDLEYAQEISGCASALGLGYGWVTIANLGYEASDACTSIVVQTDEGVVMHGRNLDFFLGGATTELAKGLAAIVKFQSGGVTQYTISTMAGYVGALSVQSDAFSITINTKFYSNGIVGLLTEVIAAIKERNATLVAFLTRDAAVEAASFSEAVTMLSSVPLVSEVYYTVAGTEPGQGTILSRLRESVQNSTSLDYDNGKWYIAVTNYPWWEPQPVVDDRLVPAQDHLEHYGPSMSLMDLFEVMSTKPTLNLETIYTFLTINSLDVLETYVRNCPYPCTQ